MKLILIGIAPWLFIIGVQLGKYSERERLREMREQMERDWIKPCNWNEERGIK